ncbi:MAG: glycoside hydrolase family 2 TIM barrel-domain containing protein [Bacteroidales bacterium]|nr:glycoside hydrolase family 2 TIM barrel-domain containing protein [Bacteroidales bacterium]MDD4640171.1 glycoside hydrolase family 2 TIM barrel-domain containing protein [Bacteroidales bacterium]
MVIRRICIICLVLLTACPGFAQGFGKRQLINNDWFFNMGDLKYGGAEFFDHSSWRPVQLPHDWSVEGTPSPQWASCTGYLPGGIAWYRKDLDIPADLEGQKVFVYFEGVYNNSEVFINGKWIGKRPNGYISFMYDLTPYINFGGRNVLAVRVDHEDFADSRWYTGSGIYRDVWLVNAHQAHIDLWGVSYQTEVKGKNALLKIQTELVNESTKDISCTVRQNIYNNDGQLLGSAQGKVVLAAGGKPKLEQEIKVQNPELWDLDHPYLYRLETILLHNNELLDQTNTKVGIRTIKFDPDQGFSLNGKTHKLKGICMHHDAGCLGAAVDREVWRRRLIQLKSLGCNAIRTSHNPQATCVYDLCDELGLLVNNEAFDEWEYPKKKWIEGWNVGTPGFQGSALYFREWCKRDLADMVRRDRNHPSVIMWSIGNEVDYPNDPYTHPVLDKEGIGQQHVRGNLTSQPRAERLGEIAAELAAVVKQYDTSRPVTAGLAGAVMSNFTTYPEALDVVGYNYTEGRYEEDHKTYPHRVLYGSENRHGLEDWKAVTSKDYIMGQFLWTGFDYLGESGRWPSRGFTTGLIDLAGNIKPRGYFRRALWSESPVIYAGTYPGGGGGNRRSSRQWLSTDAPPLWNYEESQMIRVVAYTNCAEAELKLNGKTVGERKPYDEQTAIIYWDIPYEAGELEVLGYESNTAATAASYKIVSSGTPHAIQAKFIETNDPGETFLQLEIEVVDKEENLVYMADNEIVCYVTGPARLLGLESGSNNVSDNYRDNRQRCQNGRLLAYIQRREVAGEDIRIMLSSPMLKGTTLTFSGNSTTTE